MRRHILRALLHKEALRHLANRGALALLALLAAAALLLGVFGGRGGDALAPTARRCYVDYWEDGPFIAHLRESVPPELAGRVVFRPLRAVETDPAGVIVYRQGSGAIQVRGLRGPGGTGRPVSFWRPGADADALAPFEAWYWREALRFRDGPAGGTDEVEHEALGGGLDAGAGLTAALVMFALFFVCVYLQAALTCEERESGVLLAQALSPASPGELLAAKLLFYPAVGVAAAALVAAAAAPAVLLRPLFWAALLPAAAGAVGVGLAVAALARTQRAAGLGALCYLLAVSLLLFVCRQADVPFLSALALEYHTPRLLHAALTDAPVRPALPHLAASAALAAAWVGVAVLLFRRRGWQ